MNALARLAACLHRIFARETNALLWAVVQPPAAALETAATDVQAATDQIHLDLAAAEFLDLHADYYYGITRLENETDADYRARLIANVIQPRANNVAIQHTLANFLGTEPNLIQVVDADAGLLGGRAFLDGTWTLNGDRWLNGRQKQGYRYPAQFDVYIDDAVSIVSVPALIAVINQYKAAGTQLRSLIRNGPLVLDGTWLLDGTNQLNNRMIS